MTDTMMGNHMRAKIKESKPYRLDPTLEEMRTSDYKANYTWKVRINAIYFSHMYVCMYLHTFESIPIYYYCIIINSMTTQIKL